MTIIVFLLDTSASMYQRTYLGTTLMDEAKRAVETFIKVRQRSPESRGDRYMLLSFDHCPGNVKAGWKENLETFMRELKNLRCDNPTTLGPALKHTFDLLNVNRMQTGIDTYGQGRNPSYLDPTMIVVITDGGRLTSAGGVTEQLSVPRDAATPGAELTHEPFRWDQRLFALVLRLPGTPVAERGAGLVPSDGSPIDAMCEATGGRSFAVSSRRVLAQCVDSLVQKLHSGVVIHFERVGSEPSGVEPRGARCDEGSMAVSRESTAGHSWRKLIHVPRQVQRGSGVGFWPIPENFWPDLNKSELPPRTAHPVVKFSSLAPVPTVIENLPVDKYEVEPSPLTHFVLARQQPSLCWPVFVSNSCKTTSVARPFGYLKASAEQPGVSLFVLPYNYPELLPLLQELVEKHHKKPTDEWRALFRKYLHEMPVYYSGPLRQALARLKVPHSLVAALMPESLDNVLSFRVSIYLRQMKLDAKAQFERTCNGVAARIAAAKLREATPVVPTSPSRNDHIANPHQPANNGTLRDKPGVASTVSIASPSGTQGRSWASKVYDVPRDGLVEHLAKLRTAFYSGDSAALDEVRHAQPVSQMGNYRELLKELPAPPRELEPAPVRQHLFGNPFKMDRRLMADEADVEAVGSASEKPEGSAPGPASGGERRSRRTLVAARRLSSRSPSPASSPDAPTEHPQPAPRPAPNPATPAPEEHPQPAPMPAPNLATTASEEQPQPAPKPVPPLMPIVFSVPIPAPGDVVAVEPLEPARHEERVLAEINGNHARQSDGDAGNVAGILRQLVETEENAKVRGVLLKEMRRPGKRHAFLEAALADLKGDGETKRLILLDVTREARRLKRHKLVEYLEEYIRNLSS